MMQLDIFTKDGKASGKKVTLSPDVFGVKPNDQAIYDAVTAYLANQRQGTHKTKTYGEVAGSGKKLWKQKHTGRARIGAVRSPLWKGGGTIFGPLPRDYSRKVPKQIKQLARKSALSYKAADAAIRIVEDFTFAKPATKEMVAVMKALELAGKKTLLLMPKSDANVVKSGRNIPRFNVLEASKASAYEILDTQVLLIQQSAVAILEKSLS